MEDGYLQYSRIQARPDSLSLLRQSSSVDGLGGAGVGVGDLRGGKVYGGNPLDAPL